MKNKKDDHSGLIFVGCLFLGIAFGIFLGQAAVGTLLGLGIGFIGMFIAKQQNFPK